MRIHDDQIVYDDHDYMTVIEYGYKQRKLTPKAQEQSIRLRAELKARQADQTAREQAERGRKLIEQRKERARLEQEARQKAFEAHQAERRAKVEDGIREQVKSANPGIRPDELDRVVARMLEDRFVEQTKKTVDLALRQELAGWNEGAITDRSRVKAEDTNDETT